MGAGVIGKGVVSSPALVTRGSLALEGEGGALQAGGGLARLEDGDDIHGSATALLRTPTLRTIRGEILGSAATHAYQGYRAGRRLDLRAGASVGGEGGRAYLRGGVSRLLSGGVWRSATGAELFLERHFERARISVSAQHVAFTDRRGVTRDTTYIVGGFPFHSRYITYEERSLAYLDLEVGVDRVVRAAAVQFVAGVRHGDADAVPQRWGRITTTVPVGRHLALVAEAGRRAGIPEQGLPSASFATLGFRVLRAARRPPTPLPAGADTRPGVEVVGSESGSRTVRIHGLPARRVELIGDLTEWRMVDLQRAGEDVWQVTLPAGSGSYRVSIRTDGGPWLPPPGLPVIPDEFGGVVGVLVIE